MNRCSCSCLLSITPRSSAIRNVTTSWCRPPSTSPRSARATTIPAPVPPTRRGISRAIVRRARPSSTVDSRRGSISAKALAAGCTACGSPRNRASTAEMSSCPSTRLTSAGVTTCPATNRPSARPSRAFCCGMIAVCGIGRPSGCRNSAVTANQSAIPPTNPALALACTRSAPKPGGIA